MLARRTFTVSLFFIMLTGCSHASSRASSPTPTSTPFAASTATSTPTLSPNPTDTPSPTNTPTSVHTATPTNPPALTNTPIPTSNSWSTYMHDQARSSANTAETTLSPANAVRLTQVWSRP